jgi:hypothetical protein
MNTTTMMDGGHHIIKVQEIKLEQAGLDIRIHGGKAAQYFSGASRPLAWAPRLIFG